MPKAAEPWSLTSLREKLIKIGAKVLSHGRYVTFQLVEVAVSRQMFADILMLIARLRGATRAGLTGRWGQMRQTTAEVRLDHKKAASSDIGRRAIRRFGCERRRLRSNFIAAARQ